MSNTNLDVALQFLEGPSAQNLEVAQASNYHHCPGISGKSSNGNLSFRACTLFSYYTPIAVVYRGYILRTTHHYSVTTQGKHQTALTKAAIRMGLVNRIREFPITRNGTRGEAVDWAAIDKFVLSLEAEAN